MQVEALAKLKRGGEQTVRVEHVHVHPGAQAIVGTLQHGGGGALENSGRPGFRWPTGGASFFALGLAPWRGRGDDNWILAVAPDDNANADAEAIPNGFVELLNSSLSRFVMILGFNCFDERRQLRDVGGYPARFVTH
jgi:hypothetical protein